MPHGFLGGEAFGVRQLAAAFENGPMPSYFKDFLESGSEQPHISKGSRLELRIGLIQTR
jgi:hypothetical protein